MVIRPNSYRGQRGKVDWAWLFFLAAVAFYIYTARPI